MGTATTTVDAQRRARRGAIQGELVLLLGSIAILVLSSVLTPSDSVLVLFGWEVPPLCLWKNLTGVDCFGCGLTRSFTWMGHGELVAAFQRHPLGPLLYLGVLIQVPIRIRAILRARRS